MWRDFRCGIYAPDIYRQEQGECVQAQEQCELGLRGKLFPQLTHFAFTQMGLLISP
jgi:hypothetical protein